MVRALTILSLWAAPFAAAMAFAPGPYFPLPDGATWNFSSSLGGTITETASSGTFNGTPVMILRDNFGDESYFTNDAQGVRLHGQYVVDAAGNETDQFVPPVPFAAADATIGSAVQSSGTLYVTTEGTTYPVSYTSTSTPVAFETVTVPAGTFQNVVHVNVVLNLSFSGYSWYQTIDAWLVQGIGTVKRTNYDSGIPALGIPPSSETFELVSYSVPDIVPDPFTFTPKTVPPYALTTSDPIAVTGIVAPAPISVSGGQYSINGGPNTSVPGSVSNGDQVTASLYAPGPGQSATATIYIGGVAGGFTVTSIADTTPDPFRFVPATGAPPGVTLTSNHIQVYGFDAQAPISVGGGEYSANGGPFTSEAGTVNPGSYLRVRTTSSSMPGATVSATVTIGGASGAFTVTTRVADQAPRTLLYFESQPGDPIGQGETRLLDATQTPPPGMAITLTPSVWMPSDSVTGASIGIQATVDGVPGFVDFFILRLQAPWGATLAPGHYEEATRFPGTAIPGLDFSGYGVGCNSLTGRFDVLEAVYDAVGVVMRFAANFEQHCEGAAPALRGQVRYNSRVPLGSAALFGLKADFGADGKSDILWRNGTTGENYVYPMNGTTILGTEGYLRTVADQNWKVVGLGDFDGDGQADILWRNASSGQNYIYFMDGTTIKPSEGYIRTVADQNWQVAGVGDFDGDGKADILWRNSTTGENYLYPMDGLTILGTEGYLRTVADTTWQIAGVGDFDGDGKADVLWRNASTGENYLYPMDGTTIKPSEGYLRTVPDLNWKIAGVGDFNGDGKTDILWRNGTTGENYLYPMNGKTILGTEGYLRTVPDQSWQVKGTGDYDGDGKADVLWRNASTGENYLYPMDGTSIKPTEGYLRTVADQHWQLQ